MKEMDSHPVQRLEKENVNMMWIVLTIMLALITNALIHVPCYIPAATKLSVKQHLTDLYVDVLRDGEETLMRDAINMNVERLLIAPLTRPV
jgi:hypothetical protein